MKKRLLILAVFLLTVCTAWSQTDSGTKYWFTESQVRETYKLILERDHFEEENTTLEELVALNDSLLKKSEAAEVNLKAQLSRSTKQYENAQTKYNQEHENYLTIEGLVKEEKLKKNIYLGSTIGVLFLLVVSLL